MKSVQSASIALTRGRMLCRAAACALLLAAPVSAFGWGAQAHSIIDHTAVDKLPDDGPVFLKKYVEYIAASASIPDSWRGEADPFSKIEEDPNHGWFREQFSFMKTIPRSRYEFVLALYREHERIKDSDPELAKRMNVRWTGTLPYAAMEEYGHLVSGMRQLRKQHNNAANQAFLEQTCAFYVACLGHYIGDGAQPLHDTIHHDGWRGPNPNGYTTNPNVHGRFEGLYVQLIGLTEADIAPRVGPPGHLKGDVFTAILAHLDEAGDKTEAVYKLEKRGALGDPKDPEAREMIYERTSAAATMLRDLVNRAWLESGLHVKEGGPSAVDPTNLLYNSETGSAPPPVSPDVQP